MPRPYPIRAIRRKSWITRLPYHRCSKLESPGAVWIQFELLTLEDRRFDVELRVAITELDLNPVFALPPGQGCRIAVSGA